MDQKKAASAGGSGSASNGNGCKSEGAGGDNKPRFVTSFRHWRSGKIIVASDYGHKAFPIGIAK